MIARLIFTRITDWSWDDEGRFQHVPYSAWNSILTHYLKSLWKKQKERERASEGRVTTKGLPPSSLEIQYICRKTCLLLWTTGSFILKENLLLSQVHPQRMPLDSFLYQRSQPQEHYNLTEGFTSRLIQEKKEVDSEVIVLSFVFWLHSLQKKKEPLLLYSIEFHVWSNNFVTCCRWHNRNQYFTVYVSPYDCIDCFDQANSLPNLPFVNKVVREASAWVPHFSRHMDSSTCYGNSSLSVSSSHRIPQNILWYITELPLPGLKDTERLWWWSQAKSSGHSSGKTWVYSRNFG